MPRPETANQAAVDAALTALYALATEHEKRGGRPDAMAIAMLNMASSILTQGYTADEVKQMAADIVDHWAAVRQAKHAAGGGRVRKN